MFYSMDKTSKKIVSVVLFFVFYISATFLLLLTDNNFTSAPSFLNFFKSLVHLWWLKLIISSFFVYLLVWISNSTLDIRSKVVGDGQHGSSHWMFPDEKLKTYKAVDFGQELEPDILVGFENSKWLIDCSDQTCICLAPLGGGKTLRQLVPTVIYNAKVNKNTGGNGASMILTDCKGDLYRKTCGELIKNGVTPLLLDFRSPLNSLQFNLMHNINKNIDDFKAAKSKRDKLIAYAKAEKYSKILSSSVVDNLETDSKSEGSAYFNETAKGLITALILLVSEYGEQNQRHILSVFRLIIELNGLSEGSDIDEGLQKNKLKNLLSKIDNHRLINYAGSSIEADIRTTMNIYSSAISKLSEFIDAELEQLVCKHSPQINVTDFIGKPTAIFLVCPDENTTRHFFASLFIRYFINDLLELAETKYNGSLPRQTLCLWDEFGNQPPIKDVQLIFTAARSRNIRLVIALQSYEQLTEKYTLTIKLQSIVTIAYSYQKGFQMKLI